MFENSNFDLQHIKEVDEEFEKEKTGYNIFPIKIISEVNTFSKVNDRISSILTCDYCKGTINIEKDKFQITHLYFYDKRISHILNTILTFNNIILKIYHNKCYDVKFKEELLNKKNRIRGIPL